MSFFYQKKVAETAKKGKSEIPIHIMHERECTICPMDKVRDLKNPKIDPSGANNPLVYVLSSHPSKDEDAKGQHLSGETSQIFRNYVPTADKGDVRYNFLSRCRPFIDGKSLSATQELTQRECCRPSIVRDIEATKPRVVIGLGLEVTKWVLGKLPRAAHDMKLWRGRKIPAKIGNHLCWFVPTFDPTFVYLERSTNKQGEQVPSELEKFFKRDIRFAIDLSQSKETPVWQEKEDVHKGVEFVEGKSDADAKKIAEWLDEFSEYDEVSVDIETTSLRPYSGGRILSFSVGTYEKAVAFPVEHNRAWLHNPAFKKECLGLIKKFLLKMKGKTIVIHQLMFELEWFIHFFGNSVVVDVNWEDTLLQAYVADSRKGMMSLDVLTRIHCGLWLKDESEVDRSQLESETIPKLLRYNALDTKYTCDLFGRLTKFLKGTPQQAYYKSRVHSARSLVLAQVKGIMPSMEALEGYRERFTSELKQYEDRLNELTCVKQFKRTKGKPFNAGSSHDVAYVLQNILKLTQTKATGADILQALADRGDEFSSIILEYRKAQKLLSTYVEGIFNVIHDDGLLHTVYNLAYTATGRLSSESPNSQNYPKRKFKEIRSTVRAPDDHYILSADYGQIEARVFAMASRDKNYVRSLKEGLDIHMEWATNISQAFPEVLKRVANDYKVKKSDFETQKDFDKVVLKKFRGDVKNQWVFPLFFGSSVYSCSGNLQIPPEILMPLSEEFWAAFPDVRKWQRETVKFYEKNGYVETLTGFRRYGPLSYNEIINTPIQGTAAHIVLDAMNVFSDMALQDKSNSHLQPIMNIHDDITFYIPDASIEEDIEIIAEVMCTPRFDFINVPLVAELEAGTDWSNQQVIGEYSTGTGWKE